MNKKDRAEIHKMIQEEIQKAIQDKTVPQFEIELPPVPGGKIPGGKGRKVSPGERVKLGVTVDSGIMKAFEAERKKRRVSASELMDALLWNALGKPPMSFDTSEKSD